MSIEVSLLISILAICVTVYFSSRREKRDSYNTIEERAENEAKMEIMLTDISGDVKDIKYDITSVKKKLGEHSESIALINQRLDNIEKDSQ